MLYCKIQNHGNSSLIVHSYTTKQQTTHFEEWSATTVDGNSTILLKISHDYTVLPESWRITPDTVEGQTTKLESPIEGNATSTKSRC